MAITTRNILKSWYETGDYPTASQFANFIDTFFHLEEDEITIDKVTGLQEALDAIQVPESIPEYAFSFGGSSYPTTYNLDTILAGTYRVVHVFYVLGLTADYTQCRSGQLIINLNGTSTPDVVEGMVNISGTDFDGDIEVSVNAGLLRFSYTQEDGAENATYLKVKLIVL